MNNIYTGSELKKWRKENHIPQKELARRILFSADRISKIKSNNLIISKKLLSKIQEIDKELTPPIDVIMCKWQDLKKYYTFYDKEIDVIEKYLIKVLSIDVNKLGIEGTETYLKYIGIALKNICSITSASFLDNEQYIKDVLPYIIEINTEALIFLKSQNKKG